MTDRSTAEIRDIKDFSSLVEYLRNELDWPLDAEDVEDLAFEYEPEELGLDEAYKVKINEIKQLRPASANQPWGIFYLDFEPKRLPVVVLRRILRALVPKKRASAASAQQATWDSDDLLFIAATGEEGNRGISFAHFERAEKDLPRLKTIAWDEQETHFFYLRQNIARLSWPDDEDDAEAWRERWASAFTTEHREVIRTSKELSAELARLARNTRDLFRRVYDYETRDGALHKLHESFRTVLMEDLDEDRFADMVAQTISYGLFSARATGEPVLGLSHLEAMVPNTNPFLKELFGEFVSMSGTEKHQIDFDELGISELVDMLERVNVEEVLKSFGTQTGGGTQDPVIYFYEDFLKDYDKEQKVKRGEFYTPKPVVSYIVRSVDRVLRDDLGCPDGLADISTMEWNGETWPKVMILDLATGTGTFLETVIEVIHETMTAKWKMEGKKAEEIHAAWNEYVPRHLLPRLHGFELMMAPYSVAHMKLGLTLKETGYEFESKERLRVYLTNTLEEPQDFSGRLYADFLAHEAEAANRVKREVPITVVIGNPPYAKNAANRRVYAESLVRPYKDAVLGERNVQPLSDDYVKFISFSDRVLSSRDGVIGLITNRSFLEGVIHRGMRRILHEGYAHIDIVDLHGDSNVGEAVPPNVSNENVFEITQGVAISIMVRNSKSSDHSIQYREIWGTRPEKYRFLLRGPSQRTSEDAIVSSQPYSFFVPKDFSQQEEVQSFWRIDDVFSIYGMGVKTRRDHFLLAFDKEQLASKLELLVRTRDAETLRDRLEVSDNVQWRLKDMQRLVRQEGVYERLYAIAYRPFDQRFIWYHRKAIERGDARWPVMKHVLDNGVSLLTSRLTMSGEFTSAFVVRGMSEMKCAESSRGSYAFPVYLTANDAADFTSAESATPHSRNTNFTQQFVGDVNTSLKLEGASDAENGPRTTTEETLLHYIYAILNSPNYRRRYKQLLKIEYPRIPVTTNRELFESLCVKGANLVSLHLLEDDYPHASWDPAESPLKSTPLTFHNGGSLRVTKVGETGKMLADVRNGKGRLYINNSSYFDNVPKDVWNLQVGGYQVCHKWLADRKKVGATLSQDDITHYFRVVASLQETLRLMVEIDEVVEAHGGWPLAGSVREKPGTEG